MPGAWPTNFYTNAITASPALAAETVVATLPGVTLDSASRHVLLEAWIAWTVGTTAATGQLRIRQSTLTGTVVANSGILTQLTAAGLRTDSVFGIDQPGDVAGFTYVLTLQVPAATAISTISAAYLHATVCQ